MPKKNIYLEKIAAFFDLNALAGNSDDISAEKSDVEKAKELKKTISERQARNKAHFESALRSHQHLKSQSQAAEAAKAGAKVAPSSALGDHIPESVLNVHDLHEAYGPGEIHGPRGVSTKMTNKAEKITSLLSKHKGKLAIAGGVAALGAVGAAANSHEKAAEENAGAAITLGASAGAAGGVATALAIARKHALEEMSTGKNRYIGRKQVLPALHVLENSKIKKLLLPGTVIGAGLGAVAAGAAHEKLASNALDEGRYQESRGEKILRGGSAGLAGLMTGGIATGVLSAPGAVYVGSNMGKALESHDVSEKTVKKFIDKYKIKHFEVPEHKASIHEILSGTVPNGGGMGPHAVPNSASSKMMYRLANSNPEIRAGLHKLEAASPGIFTHLSKVQEGGLDGYINMSGSKSNAIKLHELGHLVNQKKYRLADARSAGNLGGLVSTGMLFNKDHAEDAWKVHALSHLPTLADELGTNARAYRFIQKHEPSALKKSRLGLGLSALSYTNQAIGGTLGMAVAGNVAKGIHNRFDKTHEKQAADNEKRAFNISAMMPAKPKVAIGVEAALSRSGALARARNAIPSGNFGSKAIAKLAADLGNNPFGGKVKDNAAKRVLPDEVHHAADLLVDGVKGVGEVGRQGLQHLLGSKVTNHVAHHTGQTFDEASKLSVEGMREVLKEKPEALGKLNRLIKMRTGVRTLVGGGAAYAAFKKLSEPKASQPQYYDYGNY